MKHFFITPLSGRITLLAGILCLMSIGTSTFSSAQINSCETYHIVNKYPGEWENASLSYDNREGTHPRASVEFNDLVEWRFEPVAGKSNTYKIVNTHNDANKGFSLSWDTESPHPMISVQNDDPVEWLLEAVQGKANTYKIVSLYPGDWYGASISYDVKSPHPMASLEFDDPVEWELKQVSNFTNQGSPIGSIVGYNEIIGDMIISSDGKSKTTFEGEKNGKRLDMLEGQGASFMNRNVFRVRYYSGKGYSIAPVNSEWQVLCTSRADYTNNCDFLKPDFPIWMYVWMNGGNQFWNITKENGSYLIQNTNSGLFLADSDSKKCLVQTTKDKAYRFSFSRYVDPNEPPSGSSGPKVYECREIPSLNKCLMEFHEISLKTFEGTKEAYGNGLNVSKGQLSWSVANESDARAIYNALKNTENPLPAGEYFLQEGLGPNANFMKYFVINTNGTTEVKTPKIDNNVNFPDRKRVLLYRNL